MKSKIRVEFDFDKKEPFIQVIFDESALPSGEQPDMRDTMLKNFIEEANSKGIHTTYPDNRVYPQIRLLKPVTTQIPKPISAKKWLEDHHAIVSAVYHQSYGQDDFFVIGKRYQLEFAVFENNFLVKAVNDKKDESFVRYKSFFQFNDYWKDFD